MKNYYEILEVEKNASQEVIEKAYKTLAKKYHPDLQQGDKKYEYAEKLKMINQAYDVLSDSFKREEYNKELQYEFTQPVRPTYNETYVQNSKNREYKMIFKHDLKYYAKLLYIFAIIICICFLIYQIPFVKNFFENLYKENIIFQSIIDIFKNTFSAGF